MSRSEAERKLALMEKEQREATSDNNEEATPELERIAKELYDVVQEIVEIIDTAGSKNATPAIEEVLCSYRDVIEFGLSLDIYQYTNNPLFMWRATRAYFSIAVNGLIVMPDDMKKFLQDSSEAILRTAKAPDINQSLGINQKEINHFEKYSLRLEIANKALRERLLKKGERGNSDMKIGEEYGITDRTIRQYIEDIHGKTMDKLVCLRAEKITKVALEAAKMHLAELREELRK